MPRLLLAALAAAASLLAASPSVVHAGTPCWNRVLNDWTADGRIDGQYSRHCLRQAIKHTPEDLRDYSSIIDDINAALLDGAGAGTTNGTNNGAGPGGTSSAAAKRRAEEAQRRAKLAVPHAGTPESIPDSSRTIPLPLLILAAITLAALLAAASPPLIRRLRARFPRARPAPQTDRN